ncbi:MAG: hypothetical protein KKH52_04720, partial [Nanoarchaeota archaeon]|nr:hypothetical protein [Nanoarchaeota archaeon]
MVEILKNVSIGKLNEAYQKVLSFFFSFPNIEMGLNDLASSLKISKTTAKKIVSALVKEGFLNKKVYGKTWRITCNQNHDFNTSQKIPFNLTMVYRAYYDNLREDVFRIIGNVKSVVLFGS